MSELIGKIAQLLTSTQIAINKGRRDGVEEKSAAQLYRIVEINDPDTQELLGTVRVPKLRFSVTEVYEKYCLATVAETEKPVQRSSNNWLVLGASTASSRKKVSTTAQSGYTQIAVGEEIVLVPPVSETEPPF